MPANLRLVWNADAPREEAAPAQEDRFDIYEHDIVWSPDEEATLMIRETPRANRANDYFIRTDTHRPLMLPAPGEERARPTLITDANAHFYTASASPNSTPAQQPGAVRGLPSQGSWRRRKLSFRKPRGPSIRSLAALAVLIAGIVIIAQALFIPTKAQAAQFLMERAWDHRVTTGEPTRPWPWADFTPAARLTFPSQDRSVLALTDAAGESLAFGPTLMAASVQPGERGVSVIAAHRDTHFAFLDRLQPGQLVEIETPKQKLAFKVTGSSVVPWNASGVRPHDGGSPRIALVTCWPLDSKFSGPMRYVVWAEMVEPAGPAV